MDKVFLNSHILRSFSLIYSCCGLTYLFPRVACTCTFVFSVLLLLLIFTLLTIRLSFEFIYLSMWILLFHSCLDLGTLTTVSKRCQNRKEGVFLCFLAKNSHSHVVKHGSISSLTYLVFLLCTCGHRYISEAFFIC